MLDRDVLELATRFSEDHVSGSQSPLDHAAEDAFPQPAVLSVETNTQIKSTILRFLTKNLASDGHALVCYMHQFSHMALRVGLNRRGWIFGQKRVLKCRAPNQEGLFMGVWWTPHQKELRCSPPIFL